MKGRSKWTLSGRIFGTLMCLVLYRLVSCVPLPFLDLAVVQDLYADSPSLSLLSLMTGGDVSRVSWAALGISPYISASIFIQLFAILIPPLASLQRDGAVGRKKMKSLTVELSCVFAAFTACGLMFNYRQSGILVSQAWYAFAVPVVILVLMALVFTWMGQMIDDRLFGNGISLFLLTGIVSSLPASLQAAGPALRNMTVPSYVSIGCFAVLIVAVFGFVYFIQGCYAVYPVSYTQKPSSDRLTKEASVLKLKLLSSSVMPVIFASAVLSVPDLIESVFGKTIVWLNVFRTSCWFDAQMPWASIGIPVYLLLIFGFTRYSQAITVSEVEMADQMRRAGCVLEGVAPGIETELFLKKEMQVLNTRGAFALCIVACLPIIAARVFQIPSVDLLGTSVILIVSVLADTWYAFRVEQKSSAYLFCLKQFRMKKRGLENFCLLNRKAGMK